MSSFVLPQPRKSSCWSHKMKSEFLLCTDENPPLTLLGAPCGRGQILFTEPKCSAADSGQRGAADRRSHGTLKAASRPSFDCGTDGINKPTVRRGFGGRGARPPPGHVFVSPPPPPRCFARQAGLAYHVGINCWVRGADPAMRGWRPRRKDGSAWVNVRRA